MGKPTHSGFTLMELLIVIALIGILVSIAVASYSTIQRKSRDSRRITDMKDLQTAWEQYYSDHEATYPGTSSSIACSLENMSLHTEYLPGGFPVDPQKLTAYPEMYDGWSRCTTATYCFCAGMEIATSANASADCIGGTNGSYKGFYCVRHMQ